MLLDPWNARFCPSKSPTHLLPEEFRDGFTFDQSELHDGIEFIVLVIGLFSISEVLLMLEKQTTDTLRPRAVTGSYPSWATIRDIWWPSMRATAIGFAVGVLPGTGSGKVMETNLRNALALSGGEISILFQSPLSIALWIMAASIIVLPRWSSRRKKKLGNTSSQVV